MKNIPVHLIRAELLRRVNRFVAEVLINGKTETVYVPNTGRLSELALPGAELLLSPIDGKYSLKILYIINNSYPVMIDSTYSNRLFQELLKAGGAPSLEDSSLIRREPVYGRHRFDFLVRQGEEEKYVELKSCTLFHKSTASFPDAVSTRASEHVKLLGETGKGVIIFFILKEGIKRFVPNYHTDFTFYRTLKENTGKIEIKALSVKYNESLEITSLEEVPVVIPEVDPRGIFILLLKGKTQSENTGTEYNYMLLCGVEKEDVFKRIEKLKRNRKLFPEKSGTDFTDMKIAADLPVISDNVSLRDLDNIFAPERGPGEKIFSSDEWRIYGYSENPAEKKCFWEKVLQLRFGDY